MEESRVSIRQESASSARTPEARPFAIRLAWPLCVVSLALLGLSVLLAFLGRPAPLSEESTPWHGQAIFAAGSAGAPVLGALIASRRPDNLYGWLWLGVGLALSVLAFGANYAEYAALTGNLPAPEAAAAVGSAGWVMWAALTPFLMLLFPNGRLPSERWRFVAWIVVAAGAVCLVLGPFMPGQSGVASVENPLGVEGWAGEAIMALVIAGVFVIFGCTLLAALSLVFRYRRAGGVKRQQIKWLAYAAVLFGGSLIFSGFLGRDLPGVWDAAFETVTLSGLYVAVGIAIFRYRLYDIDLIINRTLVYGALTACIVALYVLVVGYLGAVFQTSGSFAISLAATGIVAVIFAPLRERLQRTINRLMYGERDEPYEVISRLSRRLEVAIAPDSVLPTVVSTVREALRLPYAAIEIKRKDGFTVAASDGESVEEPLRLPLSYQNEVVGRLLLGLRAPGEDSSPADRRLLDDLARQAGVAAHAVRLTADLQRSRERLVTTREEERRRLRRDLHDGLGPQLAALNVQAGVVRGLIRRDPDDADALVVEMRQEIQSAVADIRRLVHELRPPALDQLGLVSALRQLVARFGAGGRSAGRDALEVVVDAPEELPPLPAAVEVAVYRIVDEALTNVVRYARARNCSVSLGLAEDLLLEITDDGVGIPPGYTSGVGLVSMRERASELGGSCAVEPVPEGGTRVFVRIPTAKE
ncbi:MAG: histidine kinase [Rubrobacter sp.]|nr:histidine kinase [Rubrobacter sp.]